MVASCPEVAGAWTATPDPADIMTCRDPVAVEIGQTGCEITLTFDPMSGSGPITTDAAPLSSSGSYAVTLIFPGESGGVPGYLEGSVSGSAGTMEMGSVSPRMRLCSFTLSR